MEKRLIVIIALLSIFLFKPGVVGAQELCPDKQRCLTEQDCLDIGGSPSSRACGMQGLGWYCCIEDESDGGDSVVIPTDGGFLDEIFGPGGIKLNIMKPLNFWNNGGTASIFSLFIWVYGLLTVILITLALGAIAIGGIRWISSQGDEGKIQAARKWMVNAVFGVVAVIGVFVLINLVTYILGVGNVFDLAENLSVCGTGDQAISLIDYKRENDMLDATDCTCENGSWSCQN